MAFTIVGSGGVVGGAPPSYPSETAVYRFESGALTTDSSGNGNTLTANGDAAADTGNYVEGGAALVLDTAGDSVTSSSSQLDIGSSDYTLSFWFDVPATTGKDLIFKNLTYNHGYRTGLRYVDPDYVLYMRHDQSVVLQTRVTSTWAPSADTWYHVVWIYDQDDTGQELTLYVSASGGTFGDQVNGTTFDMPHYPAASTEDFTISESGLNGHIDDTRLIKQTITAAQAEDLFDGTWSPTE